jgi:hypothetical protein
LFHAAGWKKSIKSLEVKMNYLDYWSKETNPETGALFEWQRASLESQQNGKADIDALLKTEYGALLTEEFLVRFRYNTPSLESNKFLASFGIRKELHDDGDYYSRWAMFIPDSIREDKNSNNKYPMVIIEGFPEASDLDGFEFGFYRIANSEKFMYLCPQNTNWDSVSRLIDVAVQKYPVDRERVYITGYSYTGYQATGSFTHVPWKYAAAAPCGNDIYRPCDNFQHYYTEGELAVLKYFLVPFMQVLGACDASNYTPLNDWHTRAHWGGPPYPEGYKKYRDPRVNPALDPTINPARKRPDGTLQNTPPSMMPHPDEGEDRHLWALARLNKRMELLDCEARDIDRCLSYLEAEDDELHHALGFYGDTEEIKIYHGLKHYTVNIWNHSKINAFRYVVIENHPHITPVTMAPLVWDFFKKFRRDSVTGKIHESEE